MYLSVQMHPAGSVVADVADAERRLGINRERTRVPGRSVHDTLAYLQRVGYDQGERA